MWITHPHYQNLSAVECRAWEKGNQDFYRVEFWNGKLAHFPKSPFSFLFIHVSLCGQCTPKLEFDYFLSLWVIFSTVIFFAMIQNYFGSGFFFCCNLPLIQQLLLKGVKKQAKKLRGLLSLQAWSCVDNKLTNSACKLEQAQWVLPLAQTIRWHICHSLALEVPCQITVFPEAPTGKNYCVATCTHRETFYVRWISNPSCLSPNPLLDKRKLDIRNKIQCTSNLRRHSHG